MIVTTHIGNTVSAQIEGRPSINFSRFKTAALFEFRQSAGLIKLQFYWLAALKIIIFVSLILPV